MRWAEPEKLRWFLLYGLALPATVAGSNWVGEGAFIDKMPQKLSVLALIALIVAWWPLTFRSFPVLTRLGEVQPSLPLRIAVRLALVVGFVVWSLAVYQASAFLRHGL
jgi:hypothetical protein